MDGKIITNHKELKSVYKEHFSYRMRSRPIISWLSSYKTNVESQYQEIWKATKTLSISDWSMYDFEKVLSSLK